MNYHDLKILHICGVIAFLLFTTVSIYFPDKKLHKLLNGVMSLFIILTGFMLLRRFGISHSGPFPTWVLLKLALWGVLSIIFPIVIKRLPKKAKYLFLPLLIFSFIAAGAAIYKPL